VLEIITGIKGAGTFRNCLFFCVTQLCHESIVAFTNKDFSQFSGWHNNFEERTKLSKCEDAEKGKQS